MSGSKSSSPVASALDEPVLLTTHDVAGLESDRPNVGSGRLKLFLLFLVCAAPVLASYFTYYVIKPNIANSYGTLITPPVEIPQLVGIGLDGKPRDLGTLRDQWLIVSVGPSACDAACEGRLYVQRQIRESMGPEKGRIDWVWLRTDAQPLRADLLPALTTADVYSVDPQALSQWLKPAQGHALQDHLYLVDPMGMWMMRFPADLDAKQFRKDLNKVLMASRFWDQEGRQP